MTEIEDEAELAAFFQSKSEIDTKEAKEEEMKAKEELIEVGKKGKYGKRR